MASLIRVIFGGALAIPVTIGLFYIMQSLVTVEFKQEKVKSRKIADMLIPNKIIETNLREVKPEKVEDPIEPPPDLEPIDFEANIEVTAVNIAPKTKIPLNLNSSNLSLSDGEYLPIVKVAPIYPRRAQVRGITGYCIVEYTVTKNGSTRNFQVVDCQPQGIFDNVSLKAAEKFKYKPRIVNGEPIEVAGVQNKFTFEFEK